MFFFNNRALRAETLLHSRGVAPSGLRPLWKIPYCCLPSEFGPGLSPNVADQPLSSATYHCLGKPLPYQLANTPRVHPKVIAETIFDTETMWFLWLCGISICFQMLSPALGQVTHVLLTRSPLSCLSRCKHQLKQLRSTCMY